MAAYATMYWIVVILASVTSDEATWPDCPRFYNMRVILQPRTKDYNVTTLYLRHCHISKIESSYLYLPNLKAVYLDNNRFEGHTLPESLFQNCPQLKYITLNGNKMEGAPESLLQGLPALQELWLENCLLQEVPLFAIHLWSLENLYLSHNFITSLNHPRTFAKLSNLLELNLTHNRIEAIHANIFQPLVNIVQISLSYNKIHNLNEKLFRRLSTLVNLYLDNNEIVYVPPTMLIDCASLQVIDLAKNWLTHLPSNFISHVVTVREFYLDENPWQCACLGELLMEIKRKGNITYTRSSYDGRTPKCVLTDKISHCHRHEECLPILETMTRSLAKYVLK